MGLLRKNSIVEMKRKSLRERISKSNQDSKDLAMLAVQMEKARELLARHRECSRILPMAEAERIERRLTKLEKLNATIRGSRKSKYSSAVQFSTITNFALADVK